MPPTVSTRNGIEATWSRCEWVTKMWSMSESSASDRSPTPVPASIRTSLSSRNEVVRKCRPPIPPEHPRTRSFIALLLFVERRHAVPVRRRRVAAVLRHFFGIVLVEVALRVHALQVEQIELHLVPLPRAVGLQRLAPELELLVHLAVHLGLEAERLVDRHRLVLALHLDAVDFAEHHVLHRVARRLADEDADAVVLRSPLEARGDVHRVAHRGVRAAHLGPHVADAHRAGVQADADLDGRPAARRELAVQDLA